MENIYSTPCIVCDELVRCVIGVTSVSLENLSSLGSSTAKMNSLFSSRVGRPKKDSQAVKSPSPAPWLTQSSPQKGLSWPRPPL